MKQVEKLDLLLKMLYECRYEGYYPLSEICSQHALPIETDSELRKFAKRLQNDGLIDTLYANEECFAQLTTDGSVYCQNDSYTFRGRSLLANDYGFSNA